jgi:hypothetical protein
MYNKNFMRYNYFILDTFRQDSQHLTVFIYPQSGAVINTTWIHLQKSATVRIVPWPSWHGFPSAVP